MEKKYIMEGDIDKNVKGKQKHGQFFSPSISFFKKKQDMFVKHQCPTKAHFFIFLFLSYDLDLDK